jgi:GST-like protein
LYGEPGWGSVIIETQLDWYGIEYDFEPVGDLFRSAAAREKLAKVNPIAQVPALVMNDDTVMTESAAITLYLAEMTGEESLVPAVGSADRAAFLRWLFFIVTNIYPTYTYGDHPPRFVTEPKAQNGFRKTVDDYAIKLYEVLEDHAQQPWFLGEQFSALDIYVCTMSRWRPGREWFAEHAPKLNAIAIAAGQVDKLRPAWQRNFPDG